MRESRDDVLASPARARSLFTVLAAISSALSSDVPRSSRLSRTDMSSGRRGGLRSGTRRQKGRTRDQLYEEARRLGVEGRSKLTKEQLQRAVDRRK